MNSMYSLHIFHQALINFMTPLRLSFIPPIYHILNFPVPVYSKNLTVNIFLFHHYSLPYYA